MDPHQQARPGSFVGQQSIYKVARELKKEQHTLFNCLASILSDSHFVQEIRLLYPDIPLLANLRAGGWYAPNPDGTCYFKSTDGHQNNCSFSVTRLNWHVAELASQKGGVIIVDATRKGKRFPDAMSKTIPIWAAVLNRAVARVRAYDAHKAQRRRTYAAADGEVFTAVADTQTTISVRVGEACAAASSSGCADEPSHEPAAAGAGSTGVQPPASRQQQQQQEQQQAATHRPNDNNPEQQQQAVQVTQEGSQPLRGVSSQDAHQQNCKQEACPAAALSHHDGSSAPACSNYLSSSQVVELLVDCMGPSVDLLSGVDCSQGQATVGATQPLSSDSPQGVPTPEPASSSSSSLPASGVAPAPPGPNSSSGPAPPPSCCCMHRSKSSLISPQPSLHEWLDEMDVLRRLTLLADSRTTMRPAPRVSCPPSCGCCAAATRAEAQPRALHAADAHSGLCVASAPAVCCLLAEEDSAPVTPMAARCSRAAVAEDVPALSQPGGVKGAVCISRAVTISAAGIAAAPAAPASNHLPALSMPAAGKAAAPPVLEDVASPAFLLAASSTGSRLETESTGEPVTPRLVFASSSSTGSDTSSRSSSDEIAQQPLKQPWAAAAAGQTPAVKQLRFAEQHMVCESEGDVGPADFAFPPPHQLAASAGSSVGAEAAGHLAASSCGSSYGSGLVRLPDMPVVVLNGTSHQPGDAASILDIWRGTDLEDVACLPAISDFRPGVYHMPEGQEQQGLDASMDEGDWTATTQPQQGAQQQTGQQLHSTCKGTSSSTCPGGSSWAAEVCLRSQQQLSGRLSISSWLDDDETGTVCDALCAFAVPGLSTSCCSTAGSPEDEPTTSCGSMAAGSQGSGSVCSEDSRPSSRQSSLTAVGGASSSQAAAAAPGPLAESPSSTGSVSAPPVVEWDTALHLPLWVSQQEREAIEAKLDGWVERLLEVGADVRGLAAVLLKPLRPLWLSQSSLIWTNQVADPSSLAFTPLLLVSASQPQGGERQAVRAAWLSLAKGGLVGSPERPLPADLSGAFSDDSSDEGSSDGDDLDSLGLACSWGSSRSKGRFRHKGSPSKRAPARKRAKAEAGSNSSSSRPDLGSWSYVYVPGAGDDEESWAAGLTPALFWQHCEALLHCGPSNIKPAVKQLLLLHKSASYGGASASLAAAAVHGLAAAPTSNSSNSSSARQGRPLSPLGPHGGSASSMRTGRGGAVLTDQHHLAPRGCGGAEGSAQQHVIAAAPGAFWVGGTGLAVGNLEGASPADVWRAFDAVLCCGTAMMPVLQGEYQAMRLAAEQACAAPAVPAISSSAPCSTWMQCAGQQPGSDASEQKQQQKPQQQQVKSGGASRALSSSFSTSGSAAHMHWVRQQQLAAAGPADRAAEFDQLQALDFGKASSTTAKKPVRKTGMLSALLSKAVPARCSAADTAQAAAAAATSVQPAAGNDSGSVAGSDASSMCSSSYHSVCSEEGLPAALGSAGSSRSSSSSGGGGHLPRLKWLPVECAKRDRSSLKQHLQEALEFVSAHLAAGHTVLLHDAQGHDSCVCLAVAVLSGCFKPAAESSAHSAEPSFVGAWPCSGQQPEQLAAATAALGEQQPMLPFPPIPVSKQSVRQQLALVSGCYPLARPTRGMLKQVFNFFEERRRDSTQ